MDVIPRLEMGERCQSPIPPLTTGARVGGSVMILSRTTTRLSKGTQHLIPAKHASKCSRLNQMFGILLEK
uniref:Uncharacterized protein n=1 Tax=Tanacetum cinerariifolium TaxID=118510 RepID=A0A699UJQ4_TANCI|nr:hypothetical protein [Tanacetum cinerariifolium]